MNEAASSSTQFVWRRALDPINLFGNNITDYRTLLGIWLVLLCSVLAVALVYVVLMYIRDSRSVGPWAIPLALLRLSTYGLLAVVFMMPADVPIKTEVRGSKVVVLFDVSASMGTTDDLPKKGVTPRLRQEKVLDFLSDEQTAFFKKLAEKNPITVYRLARMVDEDTLHIDDKGDRIRAEHQVARKPRFDEDGDLIPPPKALRLPLEYWSSYLMPRRFPEEIPPEWNAQQKDRLKKLKERNEKLQNDRFFGGTSLTNSLLAVLNREGNQRVQGIVLFSDGRNNEGSVAVRQVVERANRANIPLFIVGVGSERTRVEIKINSLLLPQQVRPEDPFRAVATVTGEGLAGQPVDVELEVTHIKKGKDGKEEQLPIELVEGDASKGGAGTRPDDKKRPSINLGKKLILRPTAKPEFNKENPPRVEVEFKIDGRTLAEAAKVDLKKPEYAGKKWELAETVDSELVFRVKVPKDEKELFDKPFHYSEKGSVRVIKRPLRVLLFASAPTREYQFVRTLLVREMDKKRVELCIHLQPPPGRAERRVGVVQDVPPERLLGTFPDRLDSEQKDQKFYDLKQYDVVVAFDPDWRRLTMNQMQLLRRWVEQGGGLILIGGAINTLELARPGVSDTKYEPIKDLYPVILSDIRVDELDRDTTQAWPLTFDSATSEMEFLKLEETKEVPFLADWQMFFYGKDEKGFPRKPDIGRRDKWRGFYSYYPVEQAKPGTLVVARFTDPKARLKDGKQQPYMVLTDASSGRRVIWIGSGEMWRLRMYSTAYHERFWTKLMRYAAARSQTKVSSRIDLYMDKSFKTEQAIAVEAKILDKGARPLPREVVPNITLKLPPGVPKDEIKTDLTMRPRGGKEVKEDEKWEGWFTSRFKVRSPGTYELELRVPTTKDVVTHKFTVTETNPELDNPTPDFNTLYQMASPLTRIESGRLSEAQTEELRKQLQMPRARKREDMAEVDGKGKDEKKDNEELRLFFSLENAKYIPDCMITSTKEFKTRGQPDDWWDEGFIIWDREPPLEPIRLSYVLLAVVGLLSVEWLIRKLLRLA